MITEIESLVSAGEYERAARFFLKETGSTLEVEFVRNGKHFVDDKSTRDIYKCTLKRGSRSYTFEFGQCTAESTRYVVDRHKGWTVDGSGNPINGGISVNDLLEYFGGQLAMSFATIKGTPPTAYDVLAGITKYCPDTFEDFCAEYGYDTDSRKVEKVFNAVRDEVTHMQTLYSDGEIEALAAIW